MNRRAYLGCFEFLQDYFTPLGLRTCCSLRLKSSFHRLALSHFSCSYTHNTASMGPLRYVHILSLPQLGMCSPSPLQLPGILFLSPSIPAPPPPAIPCHSDGQSEGGQLRGRAVPEILSILLLKHIRKLRRKNTAFFQDSGLWRKPGLYRLGFPL